LESANPYELKIGHIKESNLSRAIVDRELSQT